MSILKLDFALVPKLIVLLARDQNSDKNTLGIFFANIIHKLLPFA